jgi:tetratricopeptide (TPR) repeat protein
LAQARLTSDGIAAARRSIALEDENWRHHLRFAYVSWGEERLRSARRALKLVPGFAFGHWLAASVHVSRGALEEAEHELEAGAAAQDQQSRSRFGSSGLHFLLGLVRLARGDDAGALQEFEHELANEGATHIYTRQVCAHTRCALGALRLRQGERDAALAEFARAQMSIAGYPLALAAVQALGDITSVGAWPGSALGARLEHLRDDGAGVEAATVEAVGDALAGRHADAAARVHAALQAAPGGSDAWMLPVDPFLNVGAHRSKWAPVLALLRARSA